MKRINFYISAIYFGPPKTMGGNMKIILELIYNLSDKINFIVFTSEPQTFKLNLGESKNIKIVDVKFPFKKMSFFTHFFEILYTSAYYFNYFKKNQIKKEDFFYGSTDFAPDVLPLFFLKFKYTFKWIPSLFLFIPSPVENIVKKIGFPIFKYTLYFFYQRLLFFIIYHFYDKCLITNDHDIVNFPKNRKEKVLAIYGGVNTEQIDIAKHTNAMLKASAVYCGRLHEQKGISFLLDVWRNVVDKKPNATLAIIGVGDPIYEFKVKEKARSLNLDKNIMWLGYINGVEKFAIYRASKIFIHSTIFDNNGMVAAEALCTGLPVIMNNLPSFENLYDIGCIKVKMNSTISFSNEILKLLTDKKYYNKVAPTKRNLTDLQKKWRWEERAKIFYNFLLKD